MSYSERAYFEGDHCAHCAAFDKFKRLSRMTKNGRNRLFLAYSRG